MNTSDVTRIVQQAGLHLATDVNWMPIIGLEYAEKLIQLAQAAEREACAKAFEAEAETWEAWPQAGAAKRKGAAAIRSRGQA